MTTLVTGAAGFIGSHLCQRLLEAGDTVVGLDSLNDYYSVDLKKARIARIDGHENFTFAHQDLEDFTSLKNLFETHGINRVVHLAAQAGVRYSLENPRAYIGANLVGFHNVLDCAKQAQAGHFVYASSSSVYGLNTKMPFSIHHNVDHPISLYAATKKSNELIAHCYSHLFNLPTTGLRFFTVYGPWGRPDMALFLFTKAILADEPINVFNNGQMMRDFTYIDDIVEGVVRVLNKPATPNPDWDGSDPDPGTSPGPYRVYNIGNNAPVQLMEYIEVLEKELGKTAKKNFMPLQPGDVPGSFADVDDLVRDFGYKPETTVQEGISRFVAWYKDYYKA